MSDGEIAFIGLGAMGAGLAHLLQKQQAAAGKSLLVHNRTKNKPEVAKLLSEGATWVDSPAGIAASASITFTMLLNDAAVEAVFKGYMAGNPKAGSVYVDCSTVHPDVTTSQAAEASRSGVVYLTCPIIGRPDATVAGKSLVLIAGDRATKDKVLPLVRALGRDVVDAGDEPRQGNVMKLVANYFIASMTQLIGEGMTLADKNGINRDVVVRFLKESFQGPITAGYAERAARDEFEVRADAPGFPARGGLKDLSHVQSVARACGAPMPVADIVADHMRQLVDRGLGDRVDWGSSALLLRERAGVPDAKHILG